MNVKEALKERLDYKMQYYAATEEKYPRVPWSPTVDTKIYVGDKNQSGWIGWRHVDKDITHDFKEIELELGVEVNSSIKEYFNSYWFFELTVPYKNTTFLFADIVPGEEFKHILQQWKDCKSYFGDKLYLTLGQDRNNKYDLLVDNKSGEVVTFDHDTKKVQVICDNLADFIYSPLKNLKNS